MSQALYRKWRPQSWEQVVGQDHVVQTLRNAIVSDRMAHAYLLAGPRGTGKTTTARLIAKSVNCLEPDLALRPCNQCDHCLAVNQGRFLDLIEIDAASNTSVEDVRSLRDKINFSPNQGKYKVYIIDEVHMLSTAAFNALLKTLEEPPAHAIFILATTEVHKIPATVLSRCQRHEFRRIPVNDIVEQLQTLIQDENIDVEQEVLTLVARQSTGSMRDAISLLDQLASSGGPITLESAHYVLGTAANQAVLDLINAILNGDAKSGLEIIHQALDKGSDPRQFSRQVVEYLRGVLLVKMKNKDQIDTTPEVLEQMERHAHQITLPEILRMVKSFNLAASDGRGSWQPSLPLEMALVECVEPATSQEEAETRQQTKQEIKKQPSVKPPVMTSAQPESAPVVAAEPTHEESNLTLAKVNEKWRQVLAIVAKESYQTEALLNSGTLMGLKDGVLQFGISGPLKEKLEKNEQLDLVRRALKAVFGIEIQLNIVPSSGKQKTPPPGVDSDGLVATALRDLGGEIVDIQ